MTSDNNHRRTMGDRAQPCRNPTTGYTGGVDRAPCRKHEVVAGTSRRYDATRISGTHRRRMTPHMACRHTCVYAMSGCGARVFLIRTLHAQANAGASWASSMMAEFLLATRLARMSLRA